MYLYFIFGLLAPWVLGYALIKVVLKKRKGYYAFAIGAGYIIGWFVVTIILRLYDYIQRPFNSSEIIFIVYASSTLMLFFLAQPNKVSNITSEKISLSLSYYLFVFILLLLFFRWSLAAVDLLSKPVFPWDGWLSWSAKAKLFYYHKEIPVLYSNALPFWKLSDPDMVFVSGARHPYFISLIQTYTALVWGNWDDNIVNLPWLGLDISFVFLVSGGLSYLGMDRIISLIAAYAVISLPILDTHITLGSYADVWVGFGLLSVVLLTTFLLAFNEYRVIVLVLIFSIIVYFTKHSSLPFLTVIFLLIGYRLLGVWSVPVLVFFIGVSLYSLNYLMDKNAYRFLSEYLGSSMPKIVYNPVVQPLIEQWFIIDNWHVAFSLITGSMLYLLMKMNLYKPQKQFFYIIYAGLFCLLILLSIVFFTSKLSEPYFSSYINRVSLYITPLLTLLPFCVYQITNRKNKKVVRTLNLID